MKKFFDKYPAAYQSFKTELSSEGVYLPQYANLNWAAIQPSDYQLAYGILGETTIKEALEPGYVENLGVN